MHSDRWFGTPFFQTRCDDSVLLEQLRGDLLNLRKEDTNSRNVKRGFSSTGWHSKVWRDSNLPATITAVPELFRGLLKESIEVLLTQEVAEQQYTISQLDADLVFWSIINEAGNYNLRHIHTSNARDTWSCVLYVHTDSDGSGGEIRFFNPNMAFRCAQGTTISKLGGQGMYRTITPRTGDLICFPGWLEHDVLPFTGEGERIIVAANFGLTRLTVESTVTGELRQVI
jgi:uncharacterized protein (TIGR02466 family)